MHKTTQTYLSTLTGPNIPFGGIDVAVVRVIVTTGDRL